MADERLSYDDTFWAEVLPDATRQACKNSSITKVHLVASLILFLRLPFKDLLAFLFSTPIQRVKLYSGHFIVHQPTHRIPFGPSHIYNLWHENFSACRKNLHAYIVKPCAKKLVVAESNTAIRSKVLKVRVKNLTMDTAQEILDPTNLATKYREMAPFFTELLLDFTTAPTDYQRRKARKEVQNAATGTGRPRQPAESDSESESEDDDDGGEGEHAPPRRVLAVSPALAYHLFEI